MNPPSAATPPQHHSQCGRRPTTVQRMTYQMSYQLSYQMSYAVLRACCSWDIYRMVIGRV